MVADPSTPGAYMVKEGKELEVNNEKVKINNLIENILRTKL
jgi:hypothetical protein